MINQDIFPTNHPLTIPDCDCLAQVNTERPGASEDGQPPVKHPQMSGDPYIRPRTNDVTSCIPPFPLNAPLDTGAIDKVVISKNAKFPAGIVVQSMNGWQQYLSSDDKGLGRTPSVFLDLLSDTNLGRMLVKNNKAKAGPKRVPGFG